MANAKKCDRCESFYDVYAFEVKRNVSGPVYEINNMTLGKGLNNYFVFDLCPRCMKKLLEFVGAELVKETEES